MIHDLVRFVIPIGESAEQFIYGDFEDIYKYLSATNKIFSLINDGLAGDESWRTLIQNAEFFSRRHPYFIFLLQLIYNLHEKSTTKTDDDKIYVHALSDLVSVYRNIKKDLFVLVSQCMNYDKKKLNTTLFEYLNLVKEGKLIINGELSYHIVNEIIIDGELYVSKEKCPDGYSVLPSVYDASKGSKGNRPLSMYEVMYPQMLQDMHKYIVSSYLKAGVNFKICKNCNRYFAVVNNIKVEYCNRLSMFHTYIQL